MPISDLLTQPCLLLQRDPDGGEDRYGNETQEETPVETVCALQQRQRTEGGASGAMSSAHGDLSDTSWLLVLPADTQIDNGDAVEVSGQRFELVGAPWPAFDPVAQAVSHLECTVRRTAGSEDRS